MLDIRATVDMLGEKCGQPPGMHALSGCDTVSYRFCKGMVSALKVLMNNDIDYLQGVLGYPDISQGQLKAMLSFSPSKVKRRPISKIPLVVGDPHHQKVNKKS